MNNIFRSLIVAICLSGLSLVMGCGSSQPSSSSVTASSSASLNGNWLIAGSMPTFASTGRFSLATTIDVVNGQVIADIDEFFPCTNGGAGVAGGAAVGTIAPDGSFTIQPYSGNGVVSTLNYTIHGEVPQAGNGGWSGSYTATNANAGCSPVSGTFTATPIAPVTGTFTGSGSISPANSSIAVPITINVALQQGGSASLDDTATTRPLNSQNALSGSIHVTGSSCFSTGTISATGGAVFGGDISAMFIMNDGSKLLFDADVTDPNTSTLQVRSIAIQGGSCDRWLGGSKTKLARQ